MAKVDPDLRADWKENPRQTFALIVRVTGDVGLRRELLEELGCQVKHAFRLTSSVSVRCSGSVALTLTRRHWVTKVERDSILRALGG
jgi:hypothetical protein